MSVACFSPVIWVSISPCICNESTKILRLPMKRAQAIPLYGWQNPSSSKSSLRHTEKQRRVHRNLKFWGFFLTDISTVSKQRASLQDLQGGCCRRLQMLQYRQIPLEASLCLKMTQNQLVALRWMGKVVSCCWS